MCSCQSSPSSRPLTHLRPGTLGSERSSVFMVCSIGVNNGQCRRGDCSMSSVRDWTTGFTVIGTILLGPIIAFLTVVAAEVLIDFPAGGKAPRTLGPTCE